MSQPSGRSRRAQRAQKRRRSHQLRIAMGLGLVAIAIVVGVVVLAARGDGDGDDATTVAEVELFEWGIGGDLEVAAGPVRLAVTNTGEIPHNVGIRGGAISNNLDPGASGEVELGELAPGTYELYCDIIGHVEQGMVATFVVTD